MVERIAVGSVAHAHPRHTHRLAGGVGIIRQQEEAVRVGLQGSTQLRRVCALTHRGADRHLLAHPRPTACARDAKCARVVHTRREIDRKKCDAPV